MLLFFRFLLESILGHLRPRIDALGTSVSHFTVLPTDCDLNIHLNAGRFISFMDVARVMILARSRIMVPLLRRRWRPVMGGIVVRYRRSILPFQRFEIHSRVLGWDEKWFYIEQVMQRKGALCAHAYARMIVRGPHGNIHPREIFVLGRREDLQSPPLPDFVVQWTAMEDAR